jgi:DDE superfamily endonuclease
MSDSDSDIASPSHPARKLLFGGLARKYATYQTIFENHANKVQDVLDLLDGDAYDTFDGLRRDRTVATMAYDGCMLGNVFGTSPNPDEHWSNLEPHQRAERWHQRFRMTEDIFEELYATVGPFFEEVGHKRHREYRSYSNKEKTLMTVYYLAFCPTTRQMSDVFGVPHNTFTESVLRPSLDAMLKALFVNKDTKVIRMPKTKDALDKAMEQFPDLPGCVGAIDGSLIPCRKPTRKMAGGDTDAFYGYKGFVSTLLLAVVDASGLFIYVNGGAPGSCGDTGMFAASSLKKLINVNGIFQQTTTKITVDDVEHELHPYLVGDSAFVLQPYMMVNWGRPPAPRHTPKGQFDYRVTNARRGVERALGRLKGRWQFCNSNEHMYDPELIKVAILVCCCLHNFLEMRNVQPDADVEQNMANLVQMPDVPQQEDPDNSMLGQEVRELLTRWAGQQ